MLNLSLKELRLIAKNRNINGYKSMPKDKLLIIINTNNNNNNNKTDRKSLFKSKKEKNKKSLFKLKREKTLKSLNKQGKKIFLNQ